MIELADIQSLVVRPRPEPTMTLLFFTFDSRAEMRRFLDHAASRVTTAADLDRQDRSGGAISVGISGAGLRLVQIPTRAYDALSPAFTAGMRAAAGRLSDIGASDPASWDPPFESTERDIHAVVIGLGDADLSSFRNGAPPLGRPGARAFAPPRSASWRGTARPGGTEPFGFRDSISDATIEGSGRPLKPGNGIWDEARGRWRAVRAGEVVLGYADETGAIAGHPDAAPIERNGSYLVLRKLEQDVAGFEAACQAWSRKLGGSRTPDEVAAQMVGRHKDGVALGRSGAEPLNDFRYRGDDGLGDHVMPSAHIRRTNPRDGIASAEAIVPRHQLFRRGMPYREPAGGGKHAREGLLFLACCADLRRQFEFVQSHWIHDGLRFGLGHERDPLLGQRDGDDDLGSGADDESRHASIADADGRRDRMALPTFVTTRGGEYFLLPGRSALRHLARVRGSGSGSGVTPWS